MADSHHMAIERFEALVTAYGAAPSRWPAEERVAAMTLLSENVRAQTLSAEAERLDVALAHYPVNETSSALSARLLAEFDRISQRPSVRRLVHLVSQAMWPGAPLWQPSAALAASLVVGLALGLMSPLGAGVRAPSNDVAVAFVVPQATDTDDEP